MRYPDDDSLTGLDTAQRGSRPRQRWTGSLRQRARAAGGLPQAVFKISSYSHSAGAVWNRLDYITREGELEAEGPNGELLDGEQLEARLEDWEREREEGKGRRHAMSSFVSFPAGVDEEKATEAARQFFCEAFADNHDYVFAAHRDTDYLHVHVVVQAQGHDGKQIRIGRADLQDLRILFAEKAAEQGIELDASPRWARGKEPAQQASREVEGIMRRFRQPEQQLAGAWFLSATRRTQLEALAEVRRDRDPTAREVSPLEYARAAELMAGRIGQGENTKEKVATIKAAVQLARSGLQRGQADDINPADAGAALHVVGQVDKAIGAHINELREDKDALREALSARRPLADQLAAGRPAPERKWRRLDEEWVKDVEKAQAGPCQALEYARSAAGVAGQIHKLTNDQDRLAAVKGAVQLARFGWDLAHKNLGQPGDREQARLIVDKTERALRFAVERIEDPDAKREAIQARAGLYRAGVKEYRAERRETERRQEAEREEEWER